MIGRFVDGHGEFFCDEVINGQVVQVRYAWTDVTSDSPRWEQAFSYDAGTNWVTNWIMQLTHKD